MFYQQAKEAPEKMSDADYQEFLDLYKKTAYKNDAILDENGKPIDEDLLISQGSTIFKGFKFT